jgi:4'-phosphopantetheinyl transferase EntD
MARLTATRALLASLFPPWAHGVVARLDGVSCDGAHPEEVALLGSAVPGRRREFLAGRSCAHAALRDLGRDEGPIGRGAHREPQWPPGVVGSISHGGAWCGAVASLSSRLAGMGLDIEALGPPLDADVEALVRAPGDAERGSPGPPWPYATKVLFAAKECVFKATFPDTGRFLELADVAVSVDLAAGRFNARLHARVRPEPALPVLHGAFLVYEGHIFAGVCLPAR